MKTVFNNDMCAHVWAQQLQPHGHSDSMSFDGQTLYSYRTAIGYIPDGAKYGLVAFATSDTHSVTTSSKHMPALHRAVRGRRVWSVPQMGTSSLQLRHNLRYLQEQYTKEVAALMRVPCDSYRVSNYLVDTADGTPTHAHETLRRMAANIADFMRTFDVAGPVLTPDESAAAIIARRDRLASDPKRAAKIAAREAAREATARRVAAEAYERNKEWAAEWLAGVPTVGRHISCPQGGALLRLSPDAGKVQTSWGAEVPVTDAVRVLAFYDRVRGGADPRQFVRAPDAAPVRLGYFQLDAINVDGSIKAGCHIIYAAQIEALRTMIAPGHDGNGSPV